MGKGKQHAVAAARVGSDKKEARLLCRRLTVWYNDKKSVYCSGKLEFVGRADSQVVTNVVCFRSQPDPLGIVLWFDKLEIVEFPVIAIK